MQNPDQHPLLKYASRVVTTVLFLAALVGAFTSFRSFVTPAITYAGTALAFLSLVVGGWYLRRYGLTWENADGRKGELRRIDLRLVLPLIGLLLALWVPRLLPASEPGKVQIAGQVEVITPVAPTPAPTSLPVQPASAGESLVLVAAFHQTTDESSDAHNKIRRAIEQVITERDLPHVRVAVEPNVQLTEDDRARAEELGELYNAAVVIWGAETRTDVTVNFLNMKEPSANERIQVLAEPDTFAQAVTQDLPGYLTFLSLFAVGQSLFVNGSYPQAIALTNSALEALVSTDELPQTVADAYFRLGWLYQQQPADYQAAIDAYTHAIALAPQNAGSYYNRGNAYSDLGQYAEAIADYDQALTLDPEFADAYYNRGNTYSAVEKYAEAIVDYDQALTLDPEYATAYYNRGQAYTDLEKYEEAIADYDQAVTLDPEYAAAYYNRGNAYSDLEKYEEAIADYDQAITLDPEYTAAYYNRGNAYGVVEKYEEAIADYSRAIALAPEDPRTYNNRGRAFRALGDYDQAAADYDQAIVLDPEFALAYFNRSDVLSALGETEKALADLEMFLQLAPDAAFGGEVEELVRLLREEVGE